MSKFKAGDRVVMIGKGAPGDVMVATLNQLIPDGEPFAGEWQATCSDGDGAVFREDQIELIGAPRPDQATLTRRDHFAMAALNQVSEYHTIFDCPNIARMAYELADAMEAARNKEGEE